MTIQTFMVMFSKLDIEVIGDGRYDETGNGYSKERFRLSFQWDGKEINSVPLDKVFDRIDEIDPDEDGGYFPGI